MASGTEGDQENGKDDKKLKLKKISDLWFLDVDGQLNRLDILGDAKDVRLEDNIIFADNTLYQLSVESDSEISIREIKAVRKDVKKTSQGNQEKSATYNEGKTPDRNDNETIWAPVFPRVNAEHNSSRSNLKLEDAHMIDSASTSESDDDSDADYTLEKSDDDSDADYTLEKGHEEYVRRKGMFRDFFARIKKVVKRKPGRKKRESIYDVIPDIGMHDVVHDVEYDNTYEYLENLKKDDINNDDVPGLQLVTAMYDFETFFDDEVSFKKRDKFKISGENVSQNTTWCLAQHLKTGKRGYIPSAYVTNNIFALQSRDWWFDINRDEASTLLISASYPIGTFLVRKGVDGHPFVLSILAKNQLTNALRVAHYRIKSYMGRLYISARRTFSDLPELIPFYMSTADGLACKLVSPPPKKPPVVYPRQMVVKKKALDVKESFKCGKYGNLLTGKFSNTLDVTIVELATSKLTTDAFLEEAKILYNFRSRKFVRVIAVCVEPEPHRIIIGDIIYATLNEYLQTDRGKTLNFDSLIKFAAEIADGMAFLEMSNVVHGHFRSDCVFVCELDVVKIAHPKLTSMMSDSVDEREVKDTDAWKWTAPEVVNGDNVLSTKTDVWSYGVLLYELITFGEDPYKGFTAEDTLIRLKRGLRLKKPDSGSVECPVALYVAILKCWHQLQECRPTFEFLREFFTDFDNAMEYEIGLQDANIQDLYMSGPLEQQQDAQQSNDQGDQGSSQQTEVARTELALSSGFSVKAIYGYTPEDDDDISFPPGEIITNVDPIDKGWWEGTASNGKRGMFPSNYVEIFESCYAEVTK